jgi:hypothetical protein
LTKKKFLAYQHFHNLKIANTMMTKERALGDAMPISKSNKQPRGIISTSLNPHKHTHKETTTKTEEEEDNNLHSSVFILLSSSPPSHNFSPTYTSPFLLLVF